MLKAFSLVKVFDNLSEFANKRKTVKNICPAVCVFYKFHRTRLKFLLKTHLPDSSLCFCVCICFKMVILIGHARIGFFDYEPILENQFKCIYHWVVGFFASIKCSYPSNGDGKRKFWSQFFFVELFMFKFLENNFRIYLDRAMGGW